MKKLKVDQKITIGVVSYTVVGSHFSDNETYYLDSHDCIFKVLNLSRSKFTNNVLGYYEEGIFPFCKSLKDLTKLVKALKKEYRQQNLILTKKQWDKFVDTLIYKGQYGSFVAEGSKYKVTFTSNEVNVSKIYLLYIEELKEYLPKRKLFLDCEGNQVYTGDTYYTISTEGIEKHIAYQEDSVKVDLREAYLNLEKAKIDYNHKYLILTTEDGHKVRYGCALYRIKNNDIISTYFRATHINGYYYLKSNAEEALKKLAILTTEDGKDIFKGDTYYTLFTDNRIIEIVAVNKKCLLPTVKRYSTKELAEKASKGKVIFISEDGIDIKINNTYYFVYENRVISSKINHIEGQHTFTGKNTFSTKVAAKEFINKRDWTPGAWYVIFPYSATPILRMASDNYGEFLIIPSQVPFTEEYLSKPFTKLTQNIGDI